MATLKLIEYATILLDGWRSQKMQLVVYIYGAVCGNVYKAMECGTVYAASKLHNPENIKWEFFNFM